LAKDISVDTVADLPVQQNKFGIDRLRYSKLRRFDETPNVGGKFPERVWAAIA
jgi:hypothetical protein